MSIRQRSDFDSPVADVLVCSESKLAVVDHPVSSGPAPQRTAMAKNGASKVTSGTGVRVKEGVSLPEFPGISIAGWTGEVLETKGRGAAVQYIIQWDDRTVASMPADYRAHCE